MGQHLLSTILVYGAVMLAGGVSMAEAEYPATFKSDRFYISTMAQFNERIKKVHPNFEITRKDIDSLEYKGSGRPGFELYAEGVEAGTLFKQRLTYVMPYPGLWKLHWVESESCIRSTILEKGKEVTKWFCEESPFPVKAFSDLFIVADKNVDLDVIQPAFKAPIVPYQKEEKQKSEGKTLSLGDIKKKLKLLGSSMRTEEMTYIPPAKTAKDGKPALKIYVEGDLDSDQWLKQSFVYVIDGEKLRLKEIDGVICKYSDLLQKDICDEVYVPTPVSPMPLVLLYSWDLTGNVEEEEPPPTAVVPEKYACGPLQSHLEMVLKFHFERSLFDAGSPKEVERFLLKYPNIADPAGMFLSAEEKQNFLKRVQYQPGYENKLKLVKKEMKKGKLGDCSFLGEPIEELNLLLSDRKREFYQLLKWTEESSFDLKKVSGLDGLTDFQERLLVSLGRFVNPAIAEVSMKQAVDVALFNADKYYRGSLSRMADFEEFVVSAMAKQDVYSQLVSNPAGVGTSLNGHVKKKYFGVSIETGWSGKHFFSRVHPLVTEKTGIGFGKEIVKINGQPAQSLSASELDKLLLDNETPIAMTYLNNDREVSVVLEASEINPLDFYYSVSVSQEGGQTVLNIDLRSFEAGVAAEIFEKAQALMGEYDIAGLTLNLQGNPGGNTEEAFKIMSLFVKDRILSYLRIGSRHVGSLKPQMAKEKYFLSETLPLVVYVDEFTMSSSEIVASGLQALKRSVTVGRPTFGKLVGQIYMPLVLENKKSSGLLVTAMEFYNVEGEALNGIGITPDVLVEEGAPNPPKVETGIGPSKDLPAKDIQPVELYPYDLDWLKEQGLSYLVAS